MRRFGARLGWAIMILAAACAVAHLLSLLTSAPQAVSLGSLWQAVHPASEAAFAAMVQERLDPMVWAPLDFVLRLPAWLVLAPPGLMLLLVGRERRRAFD